MNQTNQILESLTDQTTFFFSSNIWFLKFLSIIVTMFFVGSGVYFYSAAGWYASNVPRFQETILQGKAARRRSIRAWRQIQRYRFAGDENSLRLAVVEADNLLGEALRLIGYPGETMAERLTQVSSEDMPNIEEVWQAHKVRNRLVHEVDFKLPRDIGERALTIYEEAFRNLGVLE